MPRRLTNSQATAAAAAIATCAAKMLMLTTVVFMLDLFSDATPELRLAVSYDLDPGKNLVV